MTLLEVDRGEHTGIGIEVEGAKVDGVNSQIRHEVGALVEAEGVGAVGFVALETEALYSTLASVYSL